MDKVVDTEDSDDSDSDDDDEVNGRTVGRRSKVEESNKGPQSSHEFNILLAPHGIPPHSNLKRHLVMYPDTAPTCQGHSFAEAIYLVIVLTTHCSE